MSLIPALGVGAAVLAVLITVVVILGAAFRNSGSAQTLQNYKELADSYRAKYEELQQEVLGLKERASARDVQITALEAKVATLQDLVTGRAAYDQLAADLRVVRQNIERLVATLGSK